MLMSTITTVRNTQNTANPAILNLMNLTMNLTKYISIIDKDMLFVVLYLYQNQSIGRESTAPDTNCIVKSLYH